MEATADVRVHQGMESPELFLTVDRTKAAYLGMTQEQVMADVTTWLTSNLSTDPGILDRPEIEQRLFCSRHVSRSKTCSGSKIFWISRWTAQRKVIPAM